MSKLAWQKALAALAAVMGAVVAARLILGPFSLAGIAVNTPLNPEGFFGLAVTALLALRAADAARTSTAGWPWLAFAGVGALTVAAFAPGLRVHFLSDDFVIVRQAAEWSAAQFLPLFTHGGGDGFFRPVGLLSFALDGAWAGQDAVLWHLPGLALHTANALLVTWVAMRMGASPLPAFFAGALFAVHGGRPEAVVWVAARFDLLATLFVLVALLLFDYGRPVLAAAAFVLAVLSKESAYVFPALLLCWSAYRGRPQRRTIPFFAVAAALFVWRLFLIGGIGGYVVGGREQAVSLGFATTLKAVFVRLWTGLYFPIDWSVEPAWWLTAAGVVAIPAMLWLALRSRPGRELWPMAVAVLIAVLPPLSLLSAGPDLAGARLFYLPSVFFCLLLALAVEGLRGRWRTAVAGAVLLFHLAALEHNLASWRYASERVQAACEAAAGYNAVRALDLPPRIRGAQAFNNGFPECVAMAAGHAMPVDIGSGEAGDAAVLRWNPATDSLEPAGP